MPFATSNTANTANTAKTSSRSTLFLIDQALTSAVSCVISAVLVLLAPICTIEREGAKTQWQSSMSQCVYDAHEHVIFGASGIDFARLITPAYNALALILFFSGVSYNVGSKLWNRHKISADEYVCSKSLEMDDTQSTHNTDKTPHEGETHETDETDKTSDETAPMLPTSTQNAGTAADAWNKARERVFFIAVVLASQSYSFLFVCIFAVFNDKWWIDV